MSKSRREFIIWIGLAGIAPEAVGETKVSIESKYGLISKIISISGKREKLAKILIEGLAGMPGCISYVVANDMDNDDALWVTEIWENKSKHQESLQLSSVQNAISIGRPLISEFGERFETQPIGGVGI